MFKSSLKRDKTGKMIEFYSTASAGLLPAFIPPSGANLRLWLKPENLPTTGGISSWPDASGLNNNFTQNYGSSQPVVAAGLNGNSVARFDGSNNVLTGPNIVSSKNEGTIFLVVQCREARFGILIDQGGSSFSLESSNSLAPKFYIGNSGGAEAPTLLPQNSFQIFTARAQSGSMFLRRGGAAGTTKAFLGTTGGGGFTLGGASGYYSPVDVAELLVYDKGLSTAEISVVESYLSSRYSIPVS